MLSDNVCIFSDAEIILMACTLGYKNITGFDFCPDKIEELRAINILNSLVNKEIYKNEDRLFVLQQPYRKMISRMCTAENIVSIHYSNENMSDLCCYIDDDILVCKRTDFDDRVKLRFVDTEGLWEEFIGRYIKDLMYDSLDDTVSGLTDDQTAELELLKKQGYISWDMSSKLWVEGKNIKNQSSCGIVLYKKALERYFVSYTSNSSEKHTGSIEKLKLMFFELIKFCK